MNTIATYDLLSILPETILVATALLLIIIDAARRGRNWSSVLPVVSIIGLVASGGAALFTWGKGG
ncbi:MAG: hypothetical protein ACOZB3_09715, partial [Calditrichota bacterium]